jgi:NitT/TauT family transport system substrate-binding protein
MTWAAKDRDMYVFSRGALLQTSVAFAAAYASAPRAAAAQSAAETIRVAGPVSEGQTDLYYAIKNGLFARAGLDVSMNPVNNGAAATAAVVTGAYEAGISNVLSIFAAHLRGIPVVMIAPSIVNTAASPFAQLQVATDAPYRTGADLNGKTIGSPALSDINSLAVRAWVEKNGGDWKSLKFVEIPNVALEAALKSHRVDAAVLLSPSLDASIAAGTTKTLGYAYGAIAPRFMGSAYVARRDWAATHAAAVRRFTQTLAHATAYVSTHHAETAPLVAEYTKIAVENTLTMHRSLSASALDAALIQPVIDAAANYGVIERAFPAQELIWK